jgi:hypothetical protein
MGMLKISVSETNSERLLVLEGKLIAPWTNELKSICEAAGDDFDQRELMIDVAGVTRISADGEEALLYCLLRGTKFRGSGVYMKQVLKQLARRIHGNDEE